jgi:uncharacterized protein (DUF2344 family)
MGIYSDGNVYGVSWNIYDESDELITRFEKTFTEKMTLDQIQEIKVEYNKLTETVFTNIRFGFYTKCTSSYSNDSGTFMSWFPGTKELIEELFLKGDIRI